MGANKRNNAFQLAVEHSGRTSCKEIMPVLLLALIEYLTTVFTVFPFFLVQPSN